MVAAISLLVAGCATKTETVFTQADLPLPDRPALPTVPDNAMACLTDEAYEALAVRDARLRSHAKRLEAIIRTTQE